MNVQKSIGWTLALVLSAGIASANDPSTQITGFVDASWFGNVDLQEEGFGLDQVEVDIVRDMGGKGQLRADLEWVKNGDEFELSAEQGLLGYRVKMEPAIDLSIGKFNAPLGFEALDAPDMYQYSHSLLFDFGLPTNLTGLRADAAFNNGMSAIAYAVTGWDKNQEDNSIKTWGGRFALSPNDKITVGLGAISGTESAIEPATGSFKRTVFDLDVSAKPAPQWKLGGELNVGSVDVAGQSLSWNGFMAMAHYDHSSWLGFTGRFDHMNDSDGYLFASGSKQVRGSFTFAPTFVLGDKMGALLEMRVDTCDQDVFSAKDSGAKGKTTSIAFETTYGF